MKIKEFKIGYLKFKLLPVNREYSEENGFLGITDFDNQIIKYKDTLVGSELVNTIIHELLHCCTMYFGQREMLGSRIEERFVNCMANGLTTLLQDNPELLKVIAENIKK